MKIAGVARVVVLCLLFFAAASYTPTARALPEYEFDEIWYTGCGSSLNPVGFHSVFCTGQRSTSGQQYGDWYEVSTMACDPENPDQGSYAVSEWCTDHWEARTTLGDCQCSH